MTISCSILLIMRNVSNKFVEKIRLKILRSVHFFLKSCRLRENVEKLGGDREAADDNMATRCMLD